MKKSVEHNHEKGKYNLREIILGGQDGLVNVLGVILAVAFATYDTKIVLLAGVAATFAESVSMAAVAYTSTKAAKDYYRSQVEIEKREIKEIPKTEVKEIYDIYYNKGFRGSLLNKIVKHITSSKKLWLKTMLSDELHIFPERFGNPLRDSVVVGLAAIVGSFVPLVPFIFLSVKSAIIVSLVLSLVILFITGAIKAKVTIGDWKKSGIEMAVIGMGAAIVGFLIGWLFNLLY